MIEKADHMLYVRYCRVKPWTYAKTVKNSVFVVEQESSHQRSALVVHAKYHHCSKTEKNIVFVALQITRAAKASVVMLKSFVV